MLMVLTVPISVEPAVVVMVDALGMLVSTRSWPEDRLMFGTIFPPVELEAEIRPAAMVFVPLALWETTVVPEAMVSVLFTEQECRLEDEYAWLNTVAPSMTTLAPILISEK